MNATVNLPSTDDDPAVEDPIVGDPAIDEPTAAAPAADVGPSPRSALLPWVLAALGLVGTLAFALLWLGARGGADDAGTAAEATATADVRDAAESFAESLTNFDGATIDESFDELTARSTGEFRGQADQFFSTEIRAELKEAQASSRGEVRNAYVQDLDGDRASVFVVVDQTIANNRSPQPQADTLRMELGMVLTDGEWKAERVAVLTAPSAASTLPSEAAGGGEGGG